MGGNLWYNLCRLRLALKQEDIIMKPGLYRRGDVPIPPLAPPSVSLSRLRAFTADFASRVTGLSPAQTEIFFDDPAFDDYDCFDWSDEPYV